MAAKANTSHTVLRFSLCRFKKMTGFGHRWPLTLGGDWDLYYKRGAYSTLPAESIYHGRCGHQFCVQGIKGRAAWCVSATCSIRLASTADRIFNERAVRLESQQTDLAIALYEAGNIYEAVFMEMQAMNPQGHVLGSPVSCSSCSTLYNS